MKYLLIGLITISCKSQIEFTNIPNPNGTTRIVDKIPNNFDDAIIKARATLTVTADGEDTAMLNIKNMFGLTTAYAASSTITVTYTSTPTVTFTLNTGSFGPTSVVSNVLSLGSITMSAFTDNGLKVCGVGGNQKCNTAFIRAYTTGDITLNSGENVAGFINTVDLYGAPVYSDKTASPTQLVGVGGGGASVLQTYTIPGNKNKVSLSDFPTPTYNVISDFSNAGAGNYSMVYVIEYGLSL